MSVSFGTAGVSAASGSVTTFSATFNIGTLTNGALIGAALTSNVPETITAFSWNTVSMLPLLTANGSASSLSVALFGLTAPASGSHSMSVTVSTAAEVMALGFLSFNGADQTGGTTTFYNANNSLGSGADTSRTVSQSTHSGDATVAVWGLGLNIGSETPSFDWNINNPFNAIGQHILSTGSSDSYTASLSPGTDEIDFYGVSIKAFVAAAGNPALSNRLMMGVGI